MEYKTKRMITGVMFIVVCMATYWITGGTSNLLLALIISAAVGVAVPILAIRPERHETSAL